MELFKDTKFDFLGKKVPFIAVSVVLTVAGLVSLVMKGGPQYGIDFKGGTMTYVKFATKPQEDQVRKALSAKIPGEVSVQPVIGSNELMIGTELKSEKELDQASRVMKETLAATFGSPGGKPDFHALGQDVLVEKLQDPFQKAGVALSSDGLRVVAKAMLEYRDTPPRSGLIGSFDDLKGVSGVTPAMIQAMKQELSLSSYAVRNFELVGPKIGGELRSQAVMATLFALGGMLVYVALRFEWIYGVAAVLAVFHDTFITIGLFSIFNKEINLTVVAALLTLVGYSMNDTIVVFDRIRENLKLKRKESFPDLVNSSINETLSRTVMASGLTFLTAMSLWVFGGQVLNGFAFALVTGIIVGTYSSIFIASPILIAWYQRAEARKHPRRAAEGAPAAKTAAPAVAAEGAATARTGKKDKSKVAR
ncbi:MAG: protein translocase subunit SecF [Acidobacteriia bacterium]|nr:protein translocase subunit SecF [Terriglobia bacterium]